MNNIPERDAEKIRMATQHARSIVYPRSGTMSAAWDSIFDLEAYVEGKPTLITQSHAEWMEDADELLAIKP